MLQRDNQLLENVVTSQYREHLAETGRLKLSVLSRTTNQFCVATVEDNAMMMRSVTALSSKGVHFGKDQLLSKIGAPFT